MAKRMSDRLVVMDPARASALLARADDETLAMFDREWREWEAPAQKPPEGDWRVWLLMAGRGFGKTRAGAEWVNAKARRKRKTRIALVAATMDEARAVMVEGPSGLLAVADPLARPVWEPSLHRLRYRSGAIVSLYSAENPEGLRGPEHRYAWCDELGKWGAGGEAAWDNLMLGLRQGADQRVLVTTTPRATALLKRLRADPAVAETGGRTRDNVFLPKAFVEAVTARYAGTRVGRQELDGELLEDVEGALWTRAMVEGARGEAVGSEAVGSSGPGRPAGDSAPRLPTAYCLLPHFTRIVVAVDPPASTTGACGIVAAGLDADGVAHILDDASVQNASPERWARAVSACAARWGADRVIAEGNNGGDMVTSVLRQHDPALPVTLVHATRGKHVRAEPVAYLYEQNRVRHARPFPELEDQLCAMTVGGYDGAGSPDRADALVWALTELMLKPRAEPRVLLI